MLKTIEEVIKEYRTSVDDSERERISVLLRHHENDLTQLTDADLATHETLVKKDLNSTILSAADYIGLANPTYDPNVPFSMLEDIVFLDGTLKEIAYEMTARLTK
ncbi:hypothetical protein D3C75_135820 [compost metagenome]